MASLLRRPLAVDQVFSTFKEILKQNLAADAASYEVIKSEADPPTAYEWLYENFPHHIDDRGKRAVIAGIEHPEVMCTTSPTRRSCSVATMPEPEVRPCQDNRMAKGGRCE